MNATQTNLKIMSAFLLHEDETWVQPSFWAPESATEDEINDKLAKCYGRKYFMIFGIQADDQCPDEFARNIGFGVGTTPMEEEADHG